MIFTWFLKILFVRKKFVRKTIRILEIQYEILLYL